MYKSIAPEKKELVYKELSYTIVGLLFELFNALGPGLKEKNYQQGLLALLEEKKISYKRELYSPIILSGKVVGRYYLDFLIDDKIIVELKVGSFLRRKDFDQVNSYLKNNNLKLGIIACFTKSELRFRRVVNL